MKTAMTCNHSYVQSKISILFHYLETNMNVITQKREGCYSMHTAVVTTFLVKLLANIVQGLIFIIASQVHVSCCNHSIFMLGILKCVCLLYVY